MARTLVSEIKPVEENKIAQVGDIVHSMLTEAQFQAGLRDEQLDYILLGFKGNSASETGLVYLPYIPIYIQKTVGPNDFSPRVGMATRYALMTHLNGAENFYHVIIMQDLFDCFEQTCTKFM